MSDEADFPEPLGANATIMVSNTAVGIVLLLFGDSVERHLLDLGWNYLVHTAQIYKLNNSHPHVYLKG